MKHPLNYTLLGFQFIDLIENGKTINLDDTKSKIENKNLFPWLKTQLDNLNVSLFSSSDLDTVESFFSSIILGYGTLGTQENGLFLLVRLCLEGAQNSMAEIKKQL